jgi:hypothetical protein
MVRRAVTTIVGLLLFSAILVPGAAAHKSLGQTGTASKSCSGLHAGIRAQIIPPYTETPVVMLSFVLLNDSDAPIDVEAGSWSIVINGSELKNSGEIFGNGLMPVGGYHILKPGESYELAKSLPIVEYFLPIGEHKVSWKGTGFQSPTITVTITPASH